MHLNSNLNAIEKFQYLRSYFLSDAAALVGNFSLSNDLYYVAYDALQDRYNNKRRLAQRYVDKILNFSKSSTFMGSTLQHFFTVLIPAINSFRALEINNELDYLLLHLTLCNLDANTRKAFEKQCSSNIIPTYQSIIQFVGDTCKTRGTNDESS